MLLYNVTVKIDLDVHDEWLEWMRTHHVPEVMQTGIFTENRIARLLHQDDSDGYTYSFQYHCPSPEALERYFAEFAPALQRDHTTRYKDKFVAFRSVMEIL